MTRLFLLCLISAILLSNQTAFAKPAKWYLRMNGGGGEDWVSAFPTKAICEREKKKFYILLKKSTHPGYARCLSFRPLM
jgi:hypothetical protein